MRTLSRVAAAGLYALALIFTHLSAPPMASAEGPGEPDPVDPTSYEITLLPGVQSDEIVDVVLYLHEGRTATVTPIASDDNSGWGGDNAKLTRELEAGVDYTVEVTTAVAEADGRFTLHIGLEGLATAEGIIAAPDEDICHEDTGLHVTSGIVRMGYLNDECFSEHPDRSDHYARYFTFRLSRDYSATFDLEGVPDPDKNPVSVRTTCGFHSACLRERAPGDGLDIGAGSGTAVYAVLKRTKLTPDDTNLIVDTRIVGPALGCHRPVGHVMLPVSPGVIAAYEHIHLQYNARTPLAMGSVLTLPEMDETVIWRLGEVFRGSDICPEKGAHLHMGAHRNHWRGGDRPAAQQSERLREQDTCAHQGLAG